MKISVLLLFLFMFFSPSLIGEEVPQDKMPVHFFGDATCRDCHRIKQTVLLPLVKKHDEDIHFIDHDLQRDTALQTLLRFERIHAIDEGHPIALFVADTFLLGFQDVEIKAAQLISEKIEQPETHHFLTNHQGISFSSRDDVLGDAYRGLSFWLVTLAGLADGVNPCAIATMIFLISFLATQKLSFKQMFLVGQTYVLAVYITYFFIGLGAFHALRFFDQFHLISEMIRWTAIVLCLTIAALSIRDGMVFHRTRDIGQIKLQLSNSLKQKIHRAIKKHLQGRNLFIGAALTGFFVTLFETMCTAQTYLPILRALPTHEEYRVQGYAYLAYYNFLFIVPLQLVMIATYKGMTWSSLAQRTQGNMVLLKFLIAAVMLILAIYLFLG
ncbi:cytochrome c biogenesis CcdA family protein [Chitinivibrio alkaliphilus]|uniref:Cytochrome c biogenesis protein n=1 Tax=Chitinivibrio alkaliphilus ACht1 TaxID=1313304 RepID=U7D8R2_9BACT|nr:hypothetical protein [Chitinivibrio alkaliphilus]ERP39320.1 hypothetical protein CALK_0116 [Chitinivibrio alkaliphilus ACht1]